MIWVYTALQGTHLQDESQCNCLNNWERPTSKIGRSMICVKNDDNDTIHNIEAFLPSLSTIGPGQSLNRTKSDNYRKSEKRCFYETFEQLGHTVAMAIEPRHNPHSTIQDIMIIFQDIDSDAFSVYA